MNESLFEELKNEPSFEKEKYQSGALSVFMYECSKLNKLVPYSKLTALECYQLQIMIMVGHDTIPGEEVPVIEVGLNYNYRICGFEV